ncbi:MAG: glycosyltransferase family 4 protein [Odoribacteraceae bacterium]|jgi:glycosyltransferase involved in cell wall biosynthesis|nr:glycosyltransferase family 4 protein [Odoribacteraceae bacterium]
MPSRSSKKVLIITYYWPPAGGPGVQRWLKFASYLPEFDHEPIILTVDPDKAEYPVRDNSLLEEVRPGQRVYHTGTSGWYNLYKRVAKARTAPYSGFVGEGQPTLKQKISRFIRGNFFLPDARRGWNKHAYREAARIVREEGIDTIITTGPPMSTHLVGRKLQRELATRWIADFRDPWTDIYYYDKFYPTPLARAVDRHHERSVLTRADAVITVSHHTREQFLAKSPAIDPGKVRVIHNGYDARDFSGECPKEKEFTITYTGTLAADYTVKAFIAAVRGLLVDSPLRLRLVGKVDPLHAGELETLAGHVELHPFVPHAEAIRWMRQSSVLLLIIPDAPGSKGNLPGKLFEYMGSGVPVLCLAPPDGEAARILRSREAGQTFDYNDEAGIRDFLRTCRDLPSTPRENRRVQDYSRHSLTRALVAILNER